MFSRSPGDEAPTIIYGFTPINRPPFVCANILAPTLPSDYWKLKMPVRTPVRRRVEAVHQLWTPPPTKTKESSRAARCKSNADGDSPQPKRPRRKASEGTENGTSDSTMGGKQIQSKVAGGNLEVSYSAMSKLDAFRYKATALDAYPLVASQDIPDYQLPDMNDPPGQPMESMLTKDSVTGFRSGLTAVSDRTQPCRIPDESCQTPPSQAIGLERSFATSAEPRVFGACNETMRLTKRQKMSPKFGLGAYDDRSSTGESGLHGEVVAAAGDSLRHALILEGSTEIIATESVDGHVDCTEVGDEVEEVNSRHPFTSTTYYNDLEEVGDGEAEAANLIKTAVSFQDHGHKAQSVPPLVPIPAHEQEWDDPDDDFLLEDDDIHDLMDFSAAQEVLEPSSGFHYSPSQTFQAETRRSPERIGGLNSTLGRSDLCILKNGVYAPVEATTTMRALGSDSGAGRILPHTRAKIGRKLTATHTPETKLNVLDDEEPFDLDEEDETELADLTAAISQNHGANLRHIATAPPTPPEATYDHSSAPEAARTTAVVLLPPSPRQHPPRPASDRPLEPFVRPPFPKPVRDRSPIVELTSSGVLRTCFRIGEALNAASLAFRTGSDVIVELFARVSASSREREGFRQHFDFADLFHSERPPYLSGTYKLWKDGGRWEEDSRPFLDEEGTGKMCRAVGRLKRDTDTKAWKMAVLNIWEATWDDVAWAKGVVCVR